MQGHIQQTARDSRFDRRSRISRTLDARSWRCDRVGRSAARGAKALNVVQCPCTMNDGWTPLEPAILAHATKRARTWEFLAKGTIFHFFSPTTDVKLQHTDSQSTHVCGCGRALGQRARRDARDMSQITHAQPARSSHVLTSQKFPFVTAEQPFSSLHGK